MKFRIDHFAFLAALLPALPALADPAAGEACAKTLSPTELAIYQAVAPDVGADTKIAPLVRAKVRPMVQSGQLDRAAARPAAAAAGACLQELRGHKPKQPSH